MLCVWCAFFSRVEYSSICELQLKARKLFHIKLKLTLNEHLDVDGCRREYINERCDKMLFVDITSQNIEYLMSPSLASALPSRETSSKWKVFNLTSELRDINHRVALWVDRWMEVNFFGMKFTNLSTDLMSHSFRKGDRVIEIYDQIWHK